MTESGPPAPAEGSAVTFVDRYLEKHISPHALTSKVKINPLFPAQRSEDRDVKVQPSWTVDDYRAQTCSDLAEYLKVRDHADERPVQLLINCLLRPQEGEKTHKDLDFWLEDVYTPGFDSLLRKTEAQLRRRSLCRFLGLAVVSVSAVVVIVVLPVVLLRNTS